MGTDVFCVSAAAESERGESLHRECGQEADHHGPADQVGGSSEHFQVLLKVMKVGELRTPLEYCRGPLEQGNEPTDAHVGSCDDIRGGLPVVYPCPP